MPVPPSPLDVASTIGRNLVPLCGILFLGWSAVNVLVLYFVDTMFAMAVLFAGLARHFTPPPAGEGSATRLKANAGVMAGVLFLVVFMAVPLGIPLLFMVAATDTTVQSLFADPAFRAGLLMQAIAATWSGVGLFRALRTQTPEQLRLKRRFALIFLRWIAVLMVTYTGLAFLFGPYAPLVFVVVYAGASIMIDVAPDRFLRAMPGGAEDADPEPGAARPGTGLSRAGPPPRRKYRR